MKKRMNRDLIEREREFRDRNMIVLSKRIIFTQVHTLFLY